MCPCVTVVCRPLSHADRTQCLGLGGSTGLRFVAGADMCRAFAADAIARSRPHGQGLAQAAEAGYDAVQGGHGQGAGNGALSSDD